VKAANMENFQTLLYGCRSQLANASYTGTNFSSIDYGYSIKKSFPLWWALLGKAKGAGVIIGIILAGMVSCCMCMCCFVA
jgi:hypothetical protein